MADPVCRGDHSGHICVLASCGDFDKIKELTRDPKYICFNCGRVAISDEYLCNPMPNEWPQDLANCSKPCTLKCEWLDFHIEQGRNLLVYMSPHWLLDRPTGAFLVLKTWSLVQGQSAMAASTGGELFWSTGVLEYWSNSIADLGMQIAEFEISS